MAGPPQHIPRTPRPASYADKQEKGPDWALIISVVIVALVLAGVLIAVFRAEANDPRNDAPRFTTNEQGHVCELVQRHPEVLYRCDPWSRGMTQEGQ